ncbi:hypothetical protein JRI60_17050 [Archangium violaceum]|uniref:hypothetical protein n=1 Tax=Archangium violaceum TaxID=83451 RepID=UPI00194F357F|nr:hypothetical protein [Archangium violaceum]QRO00614.1 hypothetical protein JRI60_17050 [Archangium violaceum]
MSPRIEQPSILLPPGGQEQQPEDWQREPFTRGGYCVIPAGALATGLRAAREVLASVRARR